MLLRKYLEYEKEQRGYINLIASENVLDKDATLPFTGDVYNRYSFECLKDIYFSGRKELLVLEEECCNLIGEMLCAKYISVKPISGLNGMLCILGLFLKTGDLVYSLCPDVGGHNVTQYMARKMGIKLKYIPFDKNKMDINYEVLSKEIENENPRMIYLDHMNVLFGLDMKKLKDIIPKQTYLVYDASHIMALIMGKRFNNPLEEGADILVGSTHKTLPGPHKAIIATNQKIIKKIFDMTNGAFISSQHMAEVISLGIVIEKLKDTIVEYSEQIVRNSKKLAETMYIRGVPVLYANQGFTNTHQIWISNESMDVYGFVDRLYIYKITVNAMLIPFVNKLGIRLGVQEVTYRGFKEGEIKDLGDIIADIYLNKVNEETILKTGMLSQHLLNNRY